jgi:hypothetical protein
MRERRERELQYFFCCLVIPSSKKIKYCQRERYGAERERATVFFLLPQNPQQQKIKYCRGDLAQREKVYKNKILSWLLALFSTENIE